MKIISALDRITELHGIKPTPAVVHETRIVTGETLTITSSGYDVNNASSTAVWSWYDTTTPTFKTFNGTQWVDV